MMIPVIGMIAGALTGEGGIMVLCGVIHMMCSCAACGLCLVKSGFYWWGFVLRVREEGRVAAGKMQSECMNFRMPTGTGLVDETSGDAVTLQELCAPITPPVFQTVSGKFMLAYMIIGGTICCI